jgi:opacity protein-like surface antigen
MSLSSNNGISRSIQNTVTIAGTEQVTSSIGVSPLQFEIYLKPGLMLTPNTLLYSRFGATFATVRYFVQASGSRVLEQNGKNEFDFPINLTAVKTTRKAGFQFGPGIEQSLSDHVSLRLDYLFTYYGKFSMSSSTQFTEDPFIIKANGFQSVGIYAQSVMLGLSYHI